MSLVETPDNPVPPGAVQVEVTTADGVRLRALYWPAAAQPARGTVLLMQGRAEFVEKYFETVADLLARGFAVAAFDWRGQGGSARSLADPSKGHIADFSLFRHDLEAIGSQMLAPHLPKPCVGLAHSMGGCIALIAASEGWLPVQHLIALAPMVELKMVKHPRTVRMLVRLLALMGFGERFVPGGDGRSISTLGFAGNRLSGDLARYQRNAVLAEALGAGAIGAPTIGWLAAAYRAMDRFRGPSLAARISLPVLVVAAGDDPVCSTSGIVAFAERLKSGPAVVIPDSRHEILMETDSVRAAFWQLFDNFTRQACGEPSASAAQDLEHGLVQAPVAAGDD